jgi:hypothetical protein
MVDRAIDGSRPTWDRKEVLRELARTMAELQREAKQKGLDKMSMRQIDAAVVAVRRDRPR